MPWFPVVIAAWAVRALLAQASAPLGGYDEGLLFTNAQLMSRGAVVYKDFYTNYPPGLYHVVRLLLALGLPGIWWTRLLGLGVRVASAALAGCLFRRMNGRRGCCPWLTASVLVAQEGLGPVLYGYPVAVLGALFALWILPRGEAQSWRWASFGVLLGSISYIRHDFFLYAVAGIGLVEVTWWVARRRPFFTDSWRQLRTVCAALAVVLALLWLPVFISSGWHHPFHDLYLDQVRLTMPARVLPIPPLLDPLFVRGLQSTLPGFLVERTRLGVVVAISGSSLAGALAALRLARAPAQVADRHRSMALLAVFALATLPQALQRTDYWHVAYGVPLTALALVAVCGRWLVQPLLLVSCITWLAYPPAFATWEDTTRVWRTRRDEHFITPERKAVAGFIQRETQPGEPIYTGCLSHQRIVFSPADLLYLFQRPNATRYVQFDPGLVTSAPVQRRMIEELERSRPRFAVLARSCVQNEPNASSIEGAGLLDAYFASRYGNAQDVGGFVVLKRNDAR